MASDYQLASILADNMNTNPRTGGQYRITTNKAEFDADKSGDVVLMANENGSGIIMPQFKEEQRKDVEAFIKGQIKNYIDQKSEKRPFQEPGAIPPTTMYTKQAAKRTKSQARECFVVVAIDFVWGHLHLQAKQTAKSGYTHRYRHAAIQHGLVIDIAFYRSRWQMIES